jgi:hypothetical protein
MAKLITREDGKYFHIHKIIGFLCLIHFLYRYFLLFQYNGFELKTNYDMAMVSLHGFLSVSSLQFHIPSIRNPVSPMIYPEFRLHSILFALRGIVCCFLHYYASSFYASLGSRVVIFVTMGLADRITMYYKKEGDSRTMRNMPFDESVPTETRDEITLYHSKMQVGATLFSLVNKDTSFSPVFAIQLAAFLMTLVRKNIIKSVHWHLIYGMSLAINIFLYITTEPIDFVFVISSFLFFSYLRFSLNIDKYFVWSIICLYRTGIQFFGSKLNGIEYYSNYYHTFVWIFSLKCTIEFCWMVFPLFYKNKRMNRWI